MVSRGRSARTRATVRAPSASGGIDLTLKGWRPGLNKVRLTQTLRDGGLPLGEAVRATGEILDGREVRLHLNQFDSIEAARDALREIGVVEVRG